MEVKVNREIREYTEGVFFGMSLRQCVFALLACVAAVGLYFGLSPFLRLDELSWACIAGAAPVRRAGVRHLARHGGRTRGVGVGQSTRFWTPEGTARAPAEPVTTRPVCTPHRAKGIRREKGGHHGRTRS